MHSLIVGVTESGKTTLAHALAADLMAQGQRIIVFDPVGSFTKKGTWPAGAVIFDDEDLFFEYLADDRVCHAHVFVDEAGEVFNASKRHNLWLLTRGRHYGLSVYMICQRPKMLLPAARGQASRAYIFRLAVSDLKEISADMGFSDLENIPLDRGDFIMLVSGSAQMERANIFSLLG